MSIFFVPQKLSIKIEELPPVPLMEVAVKDLRDLKGEPGKEDSASKAFSSCHMTSTGRLLAASLASYGVCLLQEISSGLYFVGYIFLTK